MYNINKPKIICLMHHKKLEITTRFPRSSFFSQSESWDHSLVAALVVVGHPVDEEERLGLTKRRWDFHIFMICLVKS